MAYRVLFGARRVSPKDIKPTLLSFTGYLVKQKDGLSKEEIVKLEEPVEVSGRSCLSL